MPLAYLQLVRTYIKLCSPIRTYAVAYIVHLCWTLLANLCCRLLAILCYSVLANLCWRLAIKHVVG